MTAIWNTTPRYNIHLKEEVLNIFYQEIRKNHDIKAVISNVSLRMNLDEVQVLKILEPFKSQINDYYESFYKEDRRKIS